MPEPNLNFRDILAKDKAKRLQQEKYEAQIKTLPIAFRYNWCDCGPCACSGCVNGAIPELDKQRWQKWVKANPHPRRHLDRFWDYLLYRTYNDKVLIDKAHLEQELEALYQALIEEV